MAEKADVLDNTEKLLTSHTLASCVVGLHWTHCMAFTEPTDVSVVLVQNLCSDGDDTS
jgi:hypothetical protein